jgi:hypothetical protein
MKPHECYSNFSRWFCYYVAAALRFGMWYPNSASFGDRANIRVCKALAIIARLHVYEATLCSSNHPQPSFSMLNSKFLLVLSTGCAQYPNGVEIEVQATISERTEDAYCCDHAQPASSMNEQDSTETASYVQPASILQLDFMLLLSFDLYCPCRDLIVSTPHFPPCECPQNSVTYTASHCLASTDDHDSESPCA